MRPQHPKRAPTRPTRTYEVRVPFHGQQIYLVRATTQDEAIERARAQEPQHQVGDTIEEWDEDWSRAKARLHRGKQ